MVYHQKFFIKKLYYLESFVCSLSAPIAQDRNGFRCADVKLRYSQTGDPLEETNCSTALLVVENSTLSL